MSFPVVLVTLQQLSCFPSLGSSVSLVSAAFEVAAVLMPAVAVKQEYSHIKKLGNT